jgi:hypothetical protein
MAADEAAEMGAHQQRAQHRRQGAAARKRADLGDARRGNGADQGPRRRRHGILVNAMLVGFIESDQWVHRAQATGVPLKDFLATMGKHIPLGRIGTAQEFANLKRIPVILKHSLHG